MLFWAFLLYVNGWLRDDRDLFGGAIEIFPFWMTGFVISVVIAMLRRKSARNKYQHISKWAFNSFSAVFLLAASIYVAWLSAMLNAYWDGKDRTIALVTVQASAVVKDLRRTVGSRLTVTGWPDHDEQFRFMVTTEFGRQFKRGDVLRLEIGQGFFGIPYIADYARAD